MPHLEANLIFQHKHKQAQKCIERAFSTTPFGEVVVSHGVVCKQHHSLLFFAKLRAVKTAARRLFHIYVQGSIFLPPILNERAIVHIQTCPCHLDGIGMQTS